MKKTLFSIGLLSAVASLALVAVPTFAATSTSSTATTSIQTKRASRLEAASAKLQERAAKEIDRRIANLTKLQNKIQDMTKISGTTKNNLVGTIQGQITLLTNLKTKIAADTDTATLKTDVQSITKSYRIYALILPQVEILVAADKLSSTTDMLTAYQNKLQARVTAAQTAGKDVSSLTKLLADMTAKLADAKTQATAAISGVTNLKPDNGDKTTMTANTNALKAARKAIVAGMQDLKTANKDGMSVRQGLKKLEGNSGTATKTTPVATSTASTTQ